MTGAEVGTTGADVADLAGQFVTSGWEKISIDLVDIDISNPTYTTGGDGLDLSRVDGLGDGRGGNGKAGEEGRGNNSETHFD
jgi:hypothetical protein